MAGEDPSYVAAIHRLPCCATGDHDGPIEAHHAGRRGMSQRAHDDTCVPLCRQHHRDYHAAAGPFRRLNREERRAWAIARIDETRALVQRYGLTAGPDWW